MVNSPAGIGRIAVDAMGGDLGPAEVVAALRLALQQEPELRPVTLVGDESLLLPALKRARLDHSSKVALLHAPEVITMGDKPLAALRHKKQSSMVLAIDLVKEGQAQALVSCGNTGALMAGGTLRLRTMPGIARPALAAVIPRENGHFILIDAGANPEAKPEHLLHNAILGSHYCSLMLGVRSPRVGLMSIGTEEGKGNSLTTEAHALLKRAHDQARLISYTGPIEGFHVFSEHVDVVVCDGFVGNIMLKSWESLVKFFGHMLREELRRDPMRMIGAQLSKGAFTALKNRMNPDRYSGAPLLGLRGPILKAHGSSNRHAICSAILAANALIKADLNHRIAADILRANELLAVPEPA